MRELVAGFRTWHGTGRFVKERRKERMNEK